MGRHSSAALKRNDTVKTSQSQCCSADRQPLEASRRDPRLADSGELELQRNETETTTGTAIHYYKKATPPSEASPPSAAHRETANLLYLTSTAFPFHSLPGPCQCRCPMWHQVCSTSKSSMFMSCTSRTRTSIFSCTSKGRSERGFIAHLDFPVASRRFRTLCRATRRVTQEHIWAASCTFAHTSLLRLTILHPCVTPRESCPTHRTASFACLLS